MLNKTLKRVTAGVLSALTVLPNVPLAGADELNDAPAEAEYEFRSSIGNL